VSPGRESSLQHAGVRVLRVIERLIFFIIGAMLFATIPIRNFFPGSPPPGSWVDVLVVLWVIIALAGVLVIALAAFIINPRRNH